MRWEVFEEGAGEPIRTVRWQWQARAIVRSCRTAYLDYHAAGDGWLDEDEMPGPPRRGLIKARRGWDVFYTRMSDTNLHTVPHRWMAQLLTAGRPDRSYNRAGDGWVEILDDRGKSTGAVREGVQR
jgi:hypothetical protein